MSESAAVIQKSEKLYFLINRRYIALIRENRKTECSGIQQRAVERNMPWYPLEMEEKLQVATKTVIQSR